MPNFYISMLLTLPMEMYPLRTASTSVPARSLILLRQRQTLAGEGDRAVRQSGFPIIFAVELNGGNVRSLRMPFS